jgi:hypothetical protein
VGLALGVTLLVRLPRKATIAALGLFVCVYALHVMLRRGPARRLSRCWAAPAGILGGIVGALFGMGGPPYVVYLTGRIPDPAAQRATISQMVIVNVGLRVVTFALAGLLVSRTLWIAVMLLLPVAWAGVWAGTGGDGAPDRRSTVLDWGRADLAHVLGSCLAQAARSVHVECNVARRDSVLNVRCSPSAAAAWWPDWH